MDDRGQRASHPRQSDRREEGDADDRRDAVQRQQRTRARTPPAAGADLAARYSQLAADPKSANQKIDVFWIGCGTEDPLDAGAKTLDAELTKLGVHRIYKDRAGGHVWPIWRWALSEFAPMLFKS